MTRLASPSPLQQAISFRLGTYWHEYLTLREVLTAQKSIHIHMGMHTLMNGLIAKRIPAHAHKVLYSPFERSCTPSIRSLQPYFIYTSQLAYIPVFTYLDRSPCAISVYAHMCYPFQVELTRCPMPCVRCWTCTCVRVWDT